MNSQNSLIVVYYKHEKIIFSVLIITLIVLGYFLINDTSKQIDYYFYPPNTLVNVDVYLQNKEIARTSDCSITKKVNVSISADEEMFIHSVIRFLFEDELSKYGEYESVQVSGQVAQIYLKSNQTPQGTPVGSLSSCEVGHLYSVLEDTLKQYSIEKIKFYFPEGKREF